MTFALGCASIGWLVLCFLRGQGRKNNSLCSIFIRNRSQELDFSVINLNLNWNRENFFMAAIMNNGSEAIDTNCPSQSNNKNNSNNKNYRAVISFRKNRSAVPLKRVFRTTTAWGAVRCCRFHNTDWPWLSPVTFNASLYSGKSQVLWMWHTFWKDLPKKDYKQDKN